MGGNTTEYKHPRLAYSRLKDAPLRVWRKTGIMTVTPPGTLYVLSRASTAITPLVFPFHFGPWLRQTDQVAPRRTQTLESNQAAKQATHPQERKGQTRCCLLHTGGQGKS